MPRRSKRVAKQDALFYKMTKTKKSRRDFLKAAGVTGGVAAVAAVALSSKSVKAAVPESGKSAGYRETEHVKKYYELARF